jgi:hypothetical protein
MGGSMIPTMTMGRDRTEQATPDLFSTASFGEASPSATKQATSAPERLHVLRSFNKIWQH